MIRNAKDVPLNANSGGTPQVTEAMQGWYQKLTFGVVTKTIPPNTFEVVETMVNVTGQGVWQPLTERQIAMKPEGQRGWKWIWIHADPSLILKLDWVVTFLGEQYRVATSKNYGLEGYVEYHLVQDYTGSGPTVVTP